MSFQVRPSFFYESAAASVFIVSPQGLDSLTCLVYTSTAHPNSGPKALKINDNLHFIRLKAEEQ